MMGKREVGDDEDMDAYEDELYQDSSMRKLSDNNNLTTSRKYLDQFS